MGNPCKPGWIVSDDKCYGVFEMDEGKSFEDVENYCANEEGSTIALFGRYQQYALISSLIR